MRTPLPLVLLASLVVASPLLWLLLDGTIDLESAAGRYLICLLASAAALELLATITAGPRPAPAPIPTDPAQPTDPV